MPVSPPQRYVAVIGASEADDSLLRQAEHAGRLLAQYGVILVCGGRGGVMEAACRGAHAEGGTCVGLLPGSSRSDANRHVDVAIATGLGELRNALVVRAVDAVIAIGGAYGTLSEIAFALRDGTPVVGIDTWELARSGVADERIVRAGDAEEAVRLALELASR